VCHSLLKKTLSHSTYSANATERKRGGRTGAVGERKKRTCALPEHCSALFTNGYYVPKLDLVIYDSFPQQVGCSYRPFVSFSTAGPETMFQIQPPFMISVRTLTQDLLTGEEVMGEVLPVLVSSPI